MKKFRIRTGAECAYCTQLADTIDHVWPRSKGGETVLNNLVPACRRCNSSKGNKSIINDCCPICFGSNEPYSVNSETGSAIYNCCKVWKTYWNLNRLPYFLGFYT